MSTFSLRRLPLSSKGFDGIELRGSRCRIDTEEETDGGGDAQREDYRSHRGFYRDRGRGLHQIDQAVSHQDADYPAGGREDRGFGHELQQDMFLAGAERAANADFTRAFGDAGQHDVHDDDSADNQEYADQADGYGFERAGEVVPQFHDRVRSQDGEIVRRIVGEMPPGAQEHARFVFSGAHHFAIGGLDEDGDPVARTMQFLLERVKRHNHEIVLRLAEGAANGLGDTDHLIFVSFRAD